MPRALFGTQASSSLRSRFVCGGIIQIHQGVACSEADDAEQEQAWVWLEPRQLVKRCNLPATILLAMPYPTRT